MRPVASTYREASKVPNMPVVLMVENPSPSRTSIEPPGGTPGSRRVTVAVAMSYSKVDPEVWVWPPVPCVT